MSVILYHKRMLVSDSASVIMGEILHYPNLFNTNKVNKLIFSSSGMSVFGAVGVVMSDKENIDIADFLEMTIITTGDISSTDEKFSEYMKNISRQIDSTINMFFMTTVNDSAHFVNVAHRESGELRVITSVLGPDDVVAMGSGGLLTFTAINAGLDPIQAVRYAAMNDPNTVGPIHYVSITDLNK